MSVYLSGIAKHLCRIGAYGTYLTPDVMLIDIENVLRFVENYADENPTTLPTTAAVPPNLGEEVRVGTSIYVWVHRSERLKKMAEMEERLYVLDRIDEQDGDYRLLKFIEDNIR